jgi:hypothetical protein
VNQIFETTQMRLTQFLLLVTFVSISGCESREEARRKQVANELKQIGLALEAYHGKSGGSEAKKESIMNEETPATVSPNAAGTERRADKTAKVSGEIAEFHLSPDGEVDGITLKDGTEIRFPPKSGERVTATVSIGDQVEISGWTHAGESEVHAAAITNVGSGNAVDVDQPPPDVQG